MQESTEKNEAGKPAYATQLSAALKRDGKFTYFDDISYMIHDNSRSISKMDFYDKAYKYTEEDECIRMAFALYAVHELGHANKFMLLEWLRWKKLQYPDKLIPAAGTDRERNERVLTTMLSNLCKNGLLIAHDYITQDKHVIVVYTCTYYGHVFYRNKLEIYTGYDSNAMFRADTEVFKRLASDAVCIAFSKDQRCTDISLNGRYGKSLKKKNDIDGFVYGLCECFGDTDQAQVFLVEPVYYRYNKKVTTQEEVEDKVSDRLKLLEKMLPSVKNEYSCLVRVVFVVENSEGLKKLAEFSDGSSMDIFEDALYTTENILYTMQYDLDKSFLKISLAEDGVVKIRPQKKDWIE